MMYSCIWINARINTKSYHSFSLIFLSNLFDSITDISCSILQYPPYSVVDAFQGDSFLSYYLKAETFMKIRHLLRFIKWYWGRKQQRITNWYYVCYQRTSYKATQSVLFGTLKILHISLEYNVVLRAHHSMLKWSTLLMHCVPDLVLMSLTLWCTYCILRKIKGSMSFPITWESRMT